MMAYGWTCDECGREAMSVPQQREGWTCPPRGWLALNEGIECVAVAVCSIKCADAYDARERARAETLRPEDPCAP